MTPFDPQRLHHYVNDMARFAGPCPECGRPGAFLIDIWKDHYAICPTDRLAWYVGSNLLTTYSRMDDESLLALFGTTDRGRLAGEATRLVDGYAVVSAAVA